MSERRKRKRKKKSNRLVFSMVLVLVIIIIIAAIGISSLFNSKSDKMPDNNKQKASESNNQNVNDDQKISESDSWMEKVDIGNTAYEEFSVLTEESLNNDLAIIVNKNFRVPDGYEPPDLVTLTKRDKIRTITKENFDKMRAAAKAEGFSISPASGFRTVAYQEGLYNKYKNVDGIAAADTYSARAGFSEHHTGLVIDIIGSNGVMTEFGNCKESAWVNENAYNYGFIVRYLPETENITKYMSEPWHLRYVGVDIATEMKEKGIKSLEEYRGKYIL